MKRMEPCKICGDPGQECWGIYKGLDAGATTYVNGDPISCPMWERDLMAKIEAIETVDDLRACICWHDDPYPSGGMLHLTLEEGGYTDKIIHWQIEQSEKNGHSYPLGVALANALLKFTEAERAWACRWEVPARP